MTALNDRPLGREGWSTEFAVRSVCQMDWKALGGKAWCLRLSIAGHRHPYQRSRCPYRTRDAQDSMRMQEQARSKQVVSQVHHDCHYARVREVQYIPGVLSVRESNDMRRATHILVRRQFHRPPRNLLAIVDVLVHDGVVAFLKLSSLLVQPCASVALAVRYAPAAVWGKGNVDVARSETGRGGLRGFDDLGRTVGSNGARRHAWWRGRALVRS